MKYFTFICARLAKGVCYFYTPSSGNFHFPASPYFSTVNLQPFTYENPTKITLFH